jgi:hypothetical protein
MFRKLNLFRSSGVMEGKLGPLRKDSSQSLDTKRTTLPHISFYFMTSHHNALQHCHKVIPVCNILLLSAVMDNININYAHKQV